MFTEITAEVSTNSSRDLSDIATPMPAATTAIEVASAKDMVEGTCNRTDSRNVLWTEQYGKMATQICRAIPVQQAFWFCDELLKEFNTTEPDRSYCTDLWIDDIETMDSAEAKAEAIYQELYTFGNSALGGTISKLGDILLTILNSSRSENIEDPYFSNNIIISINKVFESSTGWKEITDLETKSKAMTNYLQALDFTGFIKAEKETSSVSTWTLDLSRIQIFVEKTNLLVHGLQSCFDFDHGSICVDNFQVPYPFLCNPKLLNQSKSTMLFFTMTILQTN